MASKPKTGFRQEKLMARSLDDLAEFDAFKDELLPELRKLLMAGATAEDIYKKYEALAAARSITIMAREQDSARALAAVKEILDRSGGKAKERAEVTHKLSSLPDEQIDAILESEINGLRETSEAEAEDEGESLSH